MVGGDPRLAGRAQRAGLAGGLPGGGRSSRDADVARERCVGWPQDHRDGARPRPPP